MHYIIDTDWAINTLAGRRGAGATLDTLYPSGIAVSLVTVGELNEGAFNSANPDAHAERLHLFLLSFQVLGLNEQIMWRFADIRAQLRRQGALIPDFDVVIAATAVYYDLTLLTFNRRHFHRIPELRVHQPA